jgi:PAS domain S-box-containing protein
MKGYMPKEIIGENFEKFYTLEDRQRGKPQNNLRIAAQYGHYEEEGWRVRKDGSRFWASVVIRQILDSDGLLVGFSKVTRDLTELKRGKERDLLLKEVHHRVKNTLQTVSSLLALEGDLFVDSNFTVREMVARTQGRIRLMSNLYETLYHRNDYGHVNLKEFLLSFVPTLIVCHSFQPEQILLDISGSELSLPVEMAMPCSLLLNEILTNTLKHAFPQGRSGKMTIKLGWDRNAALATLSISDDGVGLKEDSHLSQAGKLGMQLIHMLAAQMDAELTIHRTIPTRFDLSFPLKE